MKERKLKLTNREMAAALQEGGYWDRTSLADVWDQTRPVKMEVDLTHSYLLMPLTPQLAVKIERLLTRKGTSLEKWLAQVVNKELSAASH